VRERLAAYRTAVSGINACETEEAG
jgi:hypothetical protein